MKKIFIINIFLLFILSSSLVFAKDNYVLKSPSGVITVEDPEYAKLFNIPIVRPEDNQIDSQKREEQDEFLKRQQEFLDSTQMQRMYMDEFYYMKEPYTDFYRNIW